MTHEELQQIPEELQEIFALLEAQGWKPQLHDTPVPYYDSKVPCGNPADLPEGIPDGYMLLPRVARAVARAFDGIASVTSSDWIATYHVLTTYAKAPTSYSAFAEWANALHVPEMPPCKPDLLRKADGVYSQPLYRWEECTSVRESTLQRRLQIARTLKQQLA